MNKKVLKDKNGITLIALVITIIVLLILAGVSIMSISGNENLLGKAQTAKSDTDKEQEQEAIQMAVLNAQSRSKLSIDKSILKKELNDSGVLKEELSGEIELPLTVTGNTGTIYTITEDGTVTAEEN